MLKILHIQLIIQSRIHKRTLIKSYNIAFDFAFMVIEKTFPVALRKINR